MDTENKRYPKSLVERWAGRAGANPFELIKQYESQKSDINKKCTRNFGYFLLRVVILMIFPITLLVSMDIAFDFSYLLIAYEIILLLVYLVAVIYLSFEIYNRVSSSIWEKNVEYCKLERCASDAMIFIESLDKLLDLMGTKCRSMTFGEIVSAVDEQLHSRANGLNLAWKANPFDSKLKKHLDECEEAYRCFARLDLTDAPIQSYFRLTKQ